MVPAAGGVLPILWGLVTEAGHGGLLHPGAKMVCTVLRFGFLGRAPRREEVRYYFSVRRELHLKAGDGIRTHDVSLGKAAFCH